MNLYISMRSPFARRCRILFQELSIQYEEKVLDVFQKNPGYENINPFKRVPALELNNGQVISDSNQIMFYLEQTYGAKSLFQICNVNSAKKAQFSAISVGVMEYVVGFFLENLRPAAARDSDFLEDFHSGIERGLDYFENIVRNSAGLYLFGENFSVSDIELGCAYGYFRLRCTGKGFKSYPALEKYYENLLKRESFLRTEPKL